MEQKKLVIIIVGITGFIALLVLIMWGISAMRKNAQIMEMFGLEAEEEGEKEEGGKEEAKKAAEAG